MQKNHLLLSILVITYCMLFITVIACDSKDDVSQEPIGPEEIVEVEAEPEEAVIEQEPELESEPKIEVVVSVDVLRLRSGPGTDYEILDRLIKGSVL